MGSDGPGVPGRNGDLPRPPGPVVGIAERLVTVEVQNLLTKVGSRGPGGTVGGPDGVVGSLGCEVGIPCSSGIDECPVRPAGGEVREMDADGGRPEVVDVGDGITPRDSSAAWIARSTAATCFCFSGWSSGSVKNGWTRCAHRAA